MEKMAAVFARKIRDNVDIFNIATSDIIRMGALQDLLELPNLESIIIYELANYKSRSFFKEGNVFECWFVRIAIDKQNGNAAYLAIEERRNGIWILKKLIPLKRIASIKTEVMGTDETRFHIFITAKDLLSIETPDFITF